MAQDRFAIPPHRDGHQRIGHLPFGFDYQDDQLVASITEQAALRMKRKDRGSGRSLREIAGGLNSMVMPTKQGGV
jgi:hypothetical protein